MPRKVAGGVAWSLAMAVVALLAGQPVAADATGTVWPAQSGDAAAVAASESEIDSRVERVAGANRFATAARLAERAAGDGDTERVWLATGGDFPDALAASASGEPVVLVTGDAIPASAADALRAIGPERIVVAGGRSVIGDEVRARADQFAETATVRAAGPDRFATAADVAGRTHPDGADTVWLATGGDFPDALAAGAVAAAEDAPLLLTAGDELPDATRAALQRLQPDELVVVGQHQAVSEEAAEAAADAAGQAQVSRLGGDGRFHTAAAVAERAASAHGHDDPVFVATGADFPDALAAGPAAAAAGGPLLLAVRDELTEPTRAALEGLAAGDVVVVGGEQAVSARVAEHAGRPDVDPVPVGGVCDTYDATAPGTIQGHPEQQRPALDAWHGPWMVDHFRQGWELAVPYRWRFDVVESAGHGGVLFYEDSAAEGGDPYAHRYALTVFCGNPFLVAGGEPLDPRDPGGIADNGPHGVRGEPDVERVDEGGALYSAEWRDLGNADPARDHVARYDYVAVGGDVLMLYYEAENRFARQIDGRTGDIADAVTASIGPAGDVTCPANAGSCRDDRDRTQGGTPP